MSETRTRKVSSADDSPTGQKGRASAGQPVKKVVKQATKKPTEKPKKQVEDLDEIVLRESVNRYGNNKEQKAMFIQTLQSNAAGSIGLALKLTGVSRHVMTYWRNTDPAFNEDVMGAIEVTLDFAEAKLVGAIDEGDLNAIKYFLDARGKARGYGIQRVEMGNIQGEAFTVQTVSSDDEFKDVTGGATRKSCARALEILARTNPELARSVVNGDELPSLPPNLGKRDTTIIDRESVKNTTKNF